MIQNQKAVNGDMPIFRKRCQQFTATLGQVKGECEEDICKKVRDSDLGCSWTRSSRHSGEGM